MGYPFLAILEPDISCKYLFQDPLNCAKIMSSAEWREEFARQSRRRGSRRRRTGDGEDDGGRRMGRTGQAVGREDELISSSLVTYYTVRTLVMTFCKIITFTGPCTHQIS